MDKKIKSQEGIGLKGLYRVYKAKLTTPEHWELHDRILRFKEKGLDYMPLVKTLNSICRAEMMVFENLVPTVCRTMIANNLIDSTPDNEMVVEYIALGSGTNAPANGDTTLDTEQYRNIVASKTNSSNVAYVSGFFSATECNGTYYEAGIFADATATTSSGILVSRVLLNSPSGITKSATETLTIDWTITIS